MSSSQREARLLELLADQAVQALTTEQQQELDTLLADPQLQQHAQLRFEIEHAAALIDELSAPPLTEPVPEQLAAKVSRALTAAAESAEPTADVLDFAAQLAARKPSRRAPSANLGWFAAAACLLALVLTVALLRTPSVAEPDFAAQRQALLAQADSMQLAWGTSEHAAFAEVRGDVVWSNQSQTGFMRLQNMPINDPGESQYQLWIVDPQRDQHPVDGGVFDVASSGEVLIPIDSKLDIIEPAAFAITEEQPGGVVVSAGPLLVVAAL